MCEELVMRWRSVVWATFFEIFFRVFFAIEIGKNKARFESPFFSPVSKVSLEDAPTVNNVYNSF